jgi:hypothetical protein
VEKRTVFWIPGAAKDAGLSAVGLLTGKERGRFGCRMADGRDGGKYTFFR